MPIAGGFLLGAGICYLRQKLDLHLNWNDPKHERWEDTATYSMSLVASIFLFVIFGIIHQWYTVNYTFIVHLWLADVLSEATVPGVFGPFNIVVGLYWCSYWIWLVIGWRNNPLHPQVTEEDHDS